MRYQHRDIGSSGSGGFTLLPLILAVIGIVSVISVFILFSGRTAVKSAFLLLQSSQANAFLNACVEEALFQVEINNFFSGSGSLIFGEGQCSYKVQSLGGERKLINATSTVSAIVRKIRLTVATTTPKLFLTEWQEVGD